MPNYMDQNLLDYIQKLSSIFFKMSTICNNQSSFILSQNNIWKNIEKTGRKSVRFQYVTPSASLSYQSSTKTANKSCSSFSSTGKFGKFGGKYVPELLVTCLSDLEEEFYMALNDAKFQVSC